MVQQHGTKMPSQRQLRVSEEIRHVLGQMMAQNDLFIEGLKPSYIMITEVKISPGDVDTAEQVVLLNEHKGPFRYHLGKQVRLRVVPNIVFKEDNSFDEASHITDLLNNPIVRADIEKYKDKDPLEEE